MIQCNLTVCHFSCEDIKVSPISHVAENLMTYRHWNAPQHSHVLWIVQRSYNFESATVCRRHRSQSLFPLVLQNTSLSTRHKTHHKRALDIICGIWRLFWNLSASITYISILDFKSHKTHVSVNPTVVCHFISYVLVFCHICILSCTPSVCVLSDVGRNSAETRGPEESDELDYPPSNPKNWLISWLLIWFEMFSHSCQFYAWVSAKTETMMDQRTKT